MREKGKYNEKALEILLNFCKLEVQLIGMAAKNGLLHVRAAGKYYRRIFFMKKIIALLLALTMVFAFAACAAKTETPATTETTTTETTTTEETKTEETPAAETTDEVKTYKVGVAIYQYNDNFMTLYRQEIENYFKTLETDTVKYEVTMVDGKNDMGEQTSQIDTFITQKMDVIICNLVQGCQRQGHSQRQDQGQRFFHLVFLLI